MRPTTAIVDLAAIEQNVRTLSNLVGPTAVCAVVKADGYGHGAVRAAQAAVAGGATWLAVALVEEGVELRAAGLTQSILVLSEPSPSGMDAVVANNLTATVYTSVGVAALNSAATASNCTVTCHLAVDSGMGRVGVAIDQIAALIAEVDGRSNLTLEAVWTHCPVADEPNNPFTASQLSRFGAAASDQAPELALHVANSAVAMTGQAASSGTPMMVRCGISIYGIDPDAALAGMADLVPALTLRSEVSFVKTVSAGTSIGYGQRWTAKAETTIATVPIGYGDGVRRDLGLRGGTVLIAGAHRPVVGVVTMDQMMVDVGTAGVAVGDEVILIGLQDNAHISAATVAATLDTIPYEVVCAIGKRVPRSYV